MNIGETLRTARESAGLSVEDIVNSTHMTARKVECLENNAFEDSFEFSAPVYVKGFIRSYARAVGIDPEPLVRDYISIVKDGGPRSKKPVVPMEATEPKDGSFQRVMAKIPARERDNFAIPVEQGAALDKRPAEEPRPVVAKPVSVAAEPVPAPAEKKTAEDLFSALVPEPVAVPAPVPAENLPAPAPKEEVEAEPVETAKRVAPIEHGIQPVEPPEKGVRNGVRPIIIPDPVPARKPTDDEKNGEASARDPKAAPPAPKPVPLTVAPFVFPGSESLLGKVDASKEWLVSGSIAPTPLVPPAESKSEPKPEPKKTALQEEPATDRKENAVDLKTLMADPAPNPISLFFANIRQSVSEHFERKRIDKMASTTSPKRGLRLTKAGKVVFGSLVGIVVLALAVCFIPAKGTSTPDVAPEAEPYVETAENEDDAEDESIAEGEPSPAVIASVLPAPISFAK